MADGRTTRRAVSSFEQNDRRVQKTTALLRDALHSLMIEKSYERIVVKEILERANVGRSTFYTHFRDKDDLLASSIEGIIHAARATAVPRRGRWFERLLWFSLPIFEYHERHRASLRIDMPDSAKAALHSHLYNALAAIMSDAASDLRVPSGSAAIPPDLLVQVIASTFVLVFNWWLEQRKTSAANADAMFRSLVVPSLAAL